MSMWSLPPDRAVTLPPPANGFPPDMQAILKLQRGYWSADVGEKTTLLSRDLASLTWAERFRLHHLLCADRWQQAGAGVRSGEASLDDESAEVPGSDLCRDLARRLLAPDSPYRARYCDVWQGEPATVANRASDLRGEFRNASFTHLGSLEVIHLDQGHLPNEFRATGLSFVPLDDIQAVVLSRPSLFRVARLYYDDGRQDELVLLPLLYAFSWDSTSEYDHDGRMTRFACFTEVDTPSGKESLGLGIGHQDFQIKAEKGQTLFGVGSVCQLAVALNIDDSRFDLKCRARGLDPGAVRRQVGPGGPA